MFGAVVRRARSSAIAGADYACFSSMPRSRKAAPVRLAVDPLNGLNSLVVGKNAGNFVDSAAFCENLSRKHQQIQRFRDEFPTRPSREIILRTQGITSGFWTGPGNFAQNRSAQRPPLFCGLRYNVAVRRRRWISAQPSCLASSRHPRGVFGDHPRLSASDARVELRIKSPKVCMTKLKAQRLFPVVANGGSTSVGQRVPTFRPINGAEDVRAVVSVQITGRRSTGERRPDSAEPVG